MDVDIPMKIAKGKFLVKMKIAIHYLRSHVYIDGVIIRVRCII